MTSGTFPNVLAAFGSSLGLEGLSLDEYQSCTLVIDTVMLTLQWKEEAESLLVYAPVGRLRAVDDPASLYRHFLEANCLGGGTGGLTLGVQAGLEAVILSGRLPTRGLEAEALDAYIRVFADQVEFWMADIRDFGATPTEQNGLSGNMLRV